MDSKFTKIGAALYLVASVFLAITQIPYGLLKMLPHAVAINAPFVSMVITLVVLAAVQVVKGVGLWSCMKSVNEEWETYMGVDMGLLYAFTIFGFIPFTRVLTIYALNKPLSTMVTFNDITAEDTDDTLVVDK